MASQGEIDELFCVQNRTIHRRRKYPRLITSIEKEIREKEIRNYDNIKVDLSEEIDLNNVEVACHYTNELLRGVSQAPITQDAEDRVKKLQKNMSETMKFLTLREGFRRK